MSIDLPFDGYDLMNYTNGLDSGFLKQWKATSMVRTLQDIPAILTDEARLSAYLQNCMVMEGFTAHDIQRVKDWIMTQMSEVADSVG